MQGYQRLKIVPREGHQYFMSALDFYRKKHHYLTRKKMSDLIGVYSGMGYYTKWYENQLELAIKSVNESKILKKIRERDKKSRLLLNNKTF